MAEVISVTPTRNVIKIKIPPAEIVDSKYYDVIVTNKIANLKGNIYEQITENKK